MANNGMKKFGFFATITKSGAVCKEVHCSFGRGLIEIIHAYSRDSAVIRFTDRTSKKVWGKSVPQFTEITHE